MPRCAWCGTDPLYVRYHDEEWGVPTRDPRRLFESLVLEGFQAGLSWIRVLRKRERYRAVLFGFDPQRLAEMSDDYLEQCLLDPGIIRNRQKLVAARTNAQAWLRLDDPVQWLWSFVDDAPRINRFSRLDEVPAVTPEAEALSRALKKAGFSFVGPTLCYAFMQACGLTMDHLVDCERHAPLATPASARGH